MGELLVEIMRPRREMPLWQKDEFLGPFASGATWIFIDTVARLGHSATIISGVGDDDFGRCILDRFKRDSVDTERVLVVPSCATGVAFVTYFADGSRRFLYYWDHTPAVMARSPDRPKIDARFFHVMGCALMPSEEFRDEVFAAARIFSDAGARISFDPNIRFELLGGHEPQDIFRPLMDRCSILLPGERELQMLTGSSTTEEAVRKALRCPPMEMVVLKRGSKAATIYKDGHGVDVPANRVQEVDPTGAGDCFDAGFLCGLLEGREPRECVEIAAAAGALNAMAFGPMEGTSPPRVSRRFGEPRARERRVIGIPGRKGGGAHDHTAGVRGDAGPCHRRALRG